MAKLFYTGCIFFFIHANVFGQTAHATISATITTPVGAEISQDINFEKLSTVKTSSLIKEEQNESLSFLKVIGDSFAYDVTIENDIVLLKRNKERKEYQPAEKYQPSLNITVNFN